MKQITLKISPTGMIEAETHGLKGKSCLSMIAVLEQLTRSRTTDSDFTPEFLEREENLTEVTENEVRI